MASSAQPVKQAQNVRRSLPLSSVYQPVMAPLSRAAASGRVGAVGMVMTPPRAVVAAPCVYELLIDVRKSHVAGAAWPGSSGRFLQRLGPLQAPVVADQVDGAAVLLVELVRDQEHR